MADDVLDMRGERPPQRPSRLRTQVIGMRAPKPLYYWVREQAYREGTDLSTWVLALIKREQLGGLPADVRSWLAVQAVQCGCPDADAALVHVVRHLAERWPDGCRLS